MSDPVRALPARLGPALPLLGILGIGLALCACVAWHAREVNGGPGFPLDDPWIHLQFARTLHDHGRFSYFPDAPATSGSTSPLYTLLLAAGFFFTRNEFLLSRSLGVLFFLAGGPFLYLSARRHGAGDRLLASGATLLFVIEPRLIWAALSGMETTLFITLLLAALWAHAMRRYALVGAATGLLLWARPEAVLFLLALVVDIAYGAFIARRDPAVEGAPAGPFETDRLSLARLRRPLIIPAALWAAYAGFNLILSGSVLPNTYAAKTKFYAIGSPDFPLKVLHFAAGGHMIVVAILAGLGAAAVLRRLWRREPAEQLVLLLWPVLMFLAYWRRLPYLYQEGRYLMPILPPVILLAVGGMRAVLTAAGRPAFARGVPWLVPAIRLGVLALMAVPFAGASWRMGTSFADQCRYIADRQVRTAVWLDANLPADAVVATHDIGAIAYYSGRRIVDMAGLVNPDMMETFERVDALPAYLSGHRATHVAVLRNWFEVDNQEPIFQTDPLRPEIMEVFAFDPQTTHFMPREVSAILAEAGRHLGIGDLRVAGPLLEQAVGLDPASSRAHLLLGRALIAAGSFDRAASEMEAARRLFPSSQEIAAAIASIPAHDDHPADPPRPPGQGR